MDIAEMRRGYEAAESAKSPEVRAMQRMARSSADNKPVALRSPAIERNMSGMPTLSTGFFGREAEVAAVCAMPRHKETRLVTLTGPGRVGNTRLAGVVGTVMAADMPDGVRYVELAGVRDPARGVPEHGRGLRLADAAAPAATAHLYGRRVRPAASAAAIVRDG